VGYQVSASQLEGGAPPALVEGRFVLSAVAATTSTQTVELQRPGGANRLTFSRPAPLAVPLVAGELVDVTIDARSTTGLIPRPGATFVISRPDAGIVAFGAERSDFSRFGSTGLQFGSGAEICRVPTGPCALTILEGTITIPGAPSLTLIPGSMSSTGPYDVWLGFNQASASSMKPDFCDGPWPQEFVGLRTR
jgi:hypothetical protein